MTTRYALDKSNGKILGVCAGLSNWTGIDPTAIRLIAVALTLFLLGPVAVLAYFLTALVASNG
ncbi:MAG: PspC domain-containing protein [Pseudomonadota bacterium]|nr:PspC domain-containing protein [Pseudomonadota bacterium]